MAHGTTQGTAQGTAQGVADRYAVIDIDTHITEPPDLWTSRVPKKWGSLVPHIETSSRTGIERWFVGEHRLIGVASTAAAGWTEYPPSFPPTLVQADPAAWQALPRLERMDQYGLHSALLYPNILGFQGAQFMALGELDLYEACIQAYNDFLVEFCAENPARLVPLMMLPYWDMDRTVAELKRAAALGHKGIVFGTNFEAIGLPTITDEYWFPLYRAAQEAHLSLNFHIAIGAKTIDAMKAFQRNMMTHKYLYVKESALMMIGNANAIGDIILGGVCEQFPELNFVSVESGASWLPFLIESMDWQWKGSGGPETYPGRLLPSEYFRRQVYGSFWFENVLLAPTLELYPDNLMFETDFPHPTSLSPGPASPSRSPRDIIEDLGVLPDEILQKVLHSTAARIYNL